MSDKNKRKRSSISVGLITKTLLVGVLFIFLITGVQVYIKYNDLLDDLQSVVEQMEKTSIPAIALAMWELDDERIETIANSILAVDVLKGLVIKDSLAEKKYGVVDIKDTAIQAQEFAIDYKDEGSDEISNMGTLTVFVDQGSVERELKSLVAIILLGQIIFVLLLCVTMVFIVEMSLTKYLKRLAMHLRDLDVKKLDNKNIDLLKKNKGDELDDVTQAVNSMKSELYIYTTKLNDIIDEKTRSISSILASIKQGILSINKDLEINEEISTSLPQILGLRRDEIVRKNVMDIVFSKLDITEEQKSKLKNGVEVSLGESLFSFDMNEDTLVKEGVFSHKNVTKIFELDWNPMLNKDEVVEKILIVIKDVTQLREEQRAARENAKIYSRIEQLINIEAPTVNNFFKTAERHLHKVKMSIHDSSASVPDKVKMAFHEYHTLKGVARTYALTDISDEIHLAENLLSLSRKDPSQWSIEQLDAELSNCLDVVNEYYDLAKNKLNLVHDDGDDKEVIYIDRGMSLGLFNLFRDYGGDSSNKFFTEVKGVVLPLISSSFQDLLSPVIASLKGLSKTLDKVLPGVEIRSDIGVLIKKSEESWLVGMFSHLFRNSIDHGFHEKSFYDGKGKEHPKIFIDISHDTDFLIFKFYDNGKGLNLAVLRKKVVEKEGGDGGESLSDYEVAESIFKEGSSTARVISDISGRGVGMNAVRSVLHEKGGEITVVLREEDSKGKVEFVPFYFSIKVPKAISILAKN